MAEVRLDSDGRQPMLTPYPREAPDGWFLRCLCARSSLVIGRKLRSEASSDSDGLMAHARRRADGPEPQFGAEDQRERGGPRGAGGGFLDAGPIVCGPQIAQSFQDASA